MSEIYWNGCVPEGPLHDGHTAATEYIPTGKRFWWLIGWVCQECGKRSRIWTRIRRPW